MLHPAQKVFIERNTHSLLRLEKPLPLALPCSVSLEALHFPLRQCINTIAKPVEPIAKPIARLILQFLSTK